jgi:hypothetical protein
MQVQYLTHPSKKTLCRQLFKTQQRVVHQHWQECTTANLTHKLRCGASHISCGAETWHPVTSKMYTPSLLHMIPPAGTSQDPHTSLKHTSHRRQAYTCQTSGAHTKPSRHTHVRAHTHTHTAKLLTDTSCCHREGGIWLNFSLFRTARPTLCSLAASKADREHMVQRVYTHSSRSAFHYWQEMQDRMWAGYSGCASRAAAARACCAEVTKALQQARTASSHAVVRNSIPSSNGVHIHQPVIARSHTSTEPTSTSWHKGRHSLR